MKRRSIPHEQQILDERNREIETAETLNGFPCIKGLGHAKMFPPAPSKKKNLGELST
jgi:hypothetical protein